MAEYILQLLLKIFSVDPKWFSRLPSGLCLNHTYIYSWIGWAISHCCCVMVHSGCWLQCCCWLHSWCGLCRCCGLHRCCRLHRCCCWCWRCWCAGCCGSGWYRRHINIHIGFVARLNRITAGYFALSRGWIERQPIADFSVHQADWNTFTNRAYNVGAISKGQTISALISRQPSCRMRSLKQYIQSRNDGNGRSLGPPQIFMKGTKFSCYRCIYVANYITRYNT